jgi:hypothetical protein
MTETIGPQRLALPTRFCFPESDQTIVSRQSDERHVERLKAPELTRVSC